MMGPQTVEGKERIAAARRARRGIPINSKRRAAFEIFWSNCLPLRGRCWPWLGATDTQGYGRFGVQVAKRKTKVSLAHRYSYVYHKGEIPPGLHIDHLCRNTGCVNPAHLEAVTVRENCLRGIGPAAQNARKTHCKRGHSLEDCFIKKGRYGAARLCRQCSRIKDREYYRNRRKKLQATK